LLTDLLGLPETLNLQPTIEKALLWAGNKNKTQVTLEEYRFVVKYLRQYFEYWVVFDQGTKLIKFPEFQAAWQHMDRWGVDMSDPFVRWQEFNSEAVSFEQFCDWAIH
jgi:hypothetical protein